MRAQRQEIKLLKEGGADEDSLIEARCRYRKTSDEYARFSKAMELPQQRERVTVDGLGNIGQGKYKAEKSADAFKETTDNKKPNLSIDSLTKRSSSVTINIKDDVKIEFYEGVKGFPDNIQKEVYRAEQILSTNRYETALAWDAEGTRILKKKGTQDEVKFTKSELKSLKGCVVTHNHPNGSCFSIDDVCLFKDNGLAELRVATRRKRYSIRAPQKWRDDLPYTTRTEVRSRYRELDDIISNKYLEIAAHEGKSYLLYDELVQEEVWTTISNEMGFIFEVEDI